jgi:phosphate uptake regulator
MAKQVGDKDVRKLQLTGGATYTLSLPKKWVEANSLKTSSGIQIDWRPSGALRLTPSSGVKQQRMKIKIIYEDIPRGSIYDHLVGSYLSGANIIEIYARDKISRELRKTIRTFLRSTRGFEITEESEKKVILISLLSASELPLRAIINRMYQQLTSIMRDVDDVLKGGDREFLLDHEEREQEIDAMRLLVDRQVGSLLDSYKVAEALELGRRGAVEHANISRTLERMADHAYRISTLILATKKLPKLNLEDSPMKQIPVWNDCLRTLMINLRTHDVEDIEMARSNLKNAQIELDRYEEKLWGKKENANTILFKFRLSESMRRLCAYARDFGEILLNIMTHAQLFEDNSD